jgi:hypothetical protein
MTETIFPRAGEPSPEAKSIIAGMTTPDAPVTDESAKAKAAVEPDEYAAGFEYVRLPNGTVVAVPKGDVQEVPETATQAMPKAALVEVVDPHFYVWLANGDVIRVKQSDLPAPAGNSAQFGHWQIDDKVFLVVNVVPVEDIVKGAQ